MYLYSYRIINFRRLLDVCIQLNKDISIFVGANNSGKTSATQALYTFLRAAKDRISLYDFSSSCWTRFDESGEQAEDEDADTELPVISVDFWFEVEEADLALVIPILPSSDWEGTQVGLRVTYAPRNVSELLGRYRKAREDSQAKAAALEQRDNDAYSPWPSCLTDYLSKKLDEEYEFQYFVLDRAQFDDTMRPNDQDYSPPQLAGELGGAVFLNSLVKVDNLSAQRHLTDSTAASGRSEDLSKRLSRFYRRNLEQHQEDQNALRALFDSEVHLNQHLRTVFKATLERLSKLGYPGISNPKMEIRSGLNPASIMSGQDTRVHYALGDEEGALRLPDSHNGLGFKNLIYIVVEILDIHSAWMAQDEERPPLHLVFIEEPEAHMHAQLQQVFIRNVLKLVEEESEEGSRFRSQMIITTHSPHILYERGFQPIRYFRRRAAPEEQLTDVLNLSEFYDKTPDEREFLGRYLKLTHCDLFFADAVILVEGNVERLLLPIMIEKEAELLRSASICILEVGGAFAHRFKLLIEFLGITTLIITDLDSVGLLEKPEEIKQEPLKGNVDSKDVKKSKRAPKPKACPPCEEGELESSNQTLIDWLPKKKAIVDLFEAQVEDKIHQYAAPLAHKVRVAYQIRQSVTWGEFTTEICGRTLEEDFGLANADWCQAPEQNEIGLHVRSDIENPTDLAKKLHKRVISTAFDKTRFALGVLMRDPAVWNVPLYIKEGLKWLEDEVNIEQRSETTVDVTAEVAEVVAEVIVPEKEDE